MELDSFTELVWQKGRELYRDLPWRNTDDPYAILLSEVMLQQTQVVRVQGRWEEWLDLFPTVDALAAAPLSLVLETWQGMGYNRRAVALHDCAIRISREHDGVVPSTREDLLALPGIGPATTAGVRVFAYREPDVYLETNVRTVFIHELFPERDDVSDKELLPLVAQTCSADDPRGWYYALLDYGAHLKRTLPNPSRRSRHHTRQTTFEGSHRQKRAFLLRQVLEGEATAGELAAELTLVEEAAGRHGVDVREAEAILGELASEGFIVCQDGIWCCA